MMRIAFKMKLKPGAIEEYRRAHAEVWPEVIADLREKGVDQLTIFWDEPWLFAYSEVPDERTWERHWQSEVSQRWSTVMEGLIDVDDDRSMAATFLQEVFHVEPQRHA